MENVKMVVGGVIPPEDYEFLLQKGADLIFGPGTPITKSAERMIQLLEK